MPEAFDAYRKWLGILPAEQPPDHYRLLGIVRFEDDTDTISNAADRQMAHVRTFQTGRHSALSQKLLNEIAAARVCLLDRAKKARYDDQLRANEANRAQPPLTSPPPGQLALRPMAPVPTAAPPGGTPPAGTARSQPAESAANAPVPVPINIGPARKLPSNASFRKPRRHPSVAYKTPLIATGIAAIAVTALVVYKTHGGANSNVPHDVVALPNQPVEEAADNGRKNGAPEDTSRIRAASAGTPTTVDENASLRDRPAPGGAPPAPTSPQVVAESTAGTAPSWSELTRQLNDLGSWKAGTGEWSQKEGRIYGQGDARLKFREKLPDAFLLSFEMTVQDGMRPRIFFGDQSFHFGNEGYDRRLYVYDHLVPPVVGEPLAYTTGIPLKIVCRLMKQQIEFLVEGKLVARCGIEESGPLALTLSAGDWWSKGRVLFGNFSLGPAPTNPLATLPPEPSSASTVPPEPTPATSRSTTKDVGWRDLFDGKSLAGWTGDVRAMSVEKGTLVNPGKRAIVVAPGDYNNVEIEIEFRVARGANSGLGICYSGSGDPSQNGLEIQMIDDTANRRLPVNQKCGAVYGLAAAKSGHVKRWPKWNRLRVTSLDDAVRVELNGALVTDTTRSLMKQANPKHPGAARTSGKICLFPVQGHSEYRRMRVRSAK